jgi:hypothetical protein
MWLAFFPWLLAIGNSHGKGHYRALKALWKLEDWIRLWMQIGLRHNFFFCWTIATLEIDAKLKF